MMEAKSLITVIVPVYKVETYLPICVESIINQTYNNVEIILVDDGSPDKCGAICDEYALKDNRIRVIHKENGGLSSARNSGMQVMQGEYVTFIDSDDWIEKTFIEVMYKAICSEQADLVACGLLKTSNLDSKGRVTRQIKRYSGVSALEDMLYQKDIDNCACAKIYKASLFNHIMFPVGKWYEDLFTTYRVLAQADKVVYIDAELYYYRINSNSIMHSDYNYKMFEEVEAANEIVQYVEKNIPTIKAAAYSRKFSSYSQVFRWTAGVDDPAVNDRRKVLWSFIASYRNKMLFDSKARKKNRMAALLTFLGPKLFCRL